MSATYEDMMARSRQRREARRQATEARKRRFWRGVALVVVTLAALAALAVRAGASGPQDMPRTRTVAVATGDTLWAIAREHPAPGLGTAETVEAIKRMNRLADSRLTPGDELVVPAGE